MNEFVKRTVTAFIIIPIVYGLIKFLPLKIFSMVLFLIISMAVYEFIKLCNPRLFSFVLIFIYGIVIALFFTFGIPDLLFSIILIVFSLGMFFLFSIRQTDILTNFVRDIGIHFLVVFYLYFPLYFLFKLKKLGENYLFFIIIVIIIGDSGAYFIGKWIGRHKIYSIASPKKTLEGLISAILTASLAGWLSITIFPINVKLWIAIVSGGIVGLVSQLSDPVESLFKRSAFQKDSSSLLPGHGGILDRLDSYIFCAPVLYYIIKYLWK